VEQREVSVSFLLFIAVGCGAGPDPLFQILEQDNQRMKSNIERLDQESDVLHAENLRLQRELASALRLLSLHNAGLSEGADVSVSIQTSLGNMECSLFPALAPLTVSNFVALAEGSRDWVHPETGEARTDPLYDGTVFHRVIPGFMIQGGDPVGSGQGGPGYRFEDETSPGLGFDRAGRLAMANQGPGTNGSQFFVTLAPRPELDGKHSIFGQCEGLEVAEAIAALPRHETDRPKDPPVLKRILISRQSK
jgi:peptidyl-prolyl cis-trans isomerase A (cyclophilin A)